MAKTQSASSTHRSVITDIRKGEFAPVYILMGDEPYYLDKICEELERRVVDDEDKDFNLTSYYGNEIDIPTVIATAQQYPVFAEHRLVFVKESQALQNAKNALDGLADYVRRPNKQTVLAIVYKGDMLNATSKLLKAAKEAEDECIVVKSPKLRDYELPAPVKDYCTARRVAIDENSVRLLCEYCGADLSKIFGEIEKLIVASGGENTKITPQLIEENIGISKDFNNFELTRNLGIKNFDKCMRIVEYFRKNPRNNPTVVTTATLLGFFAKLVHAQMLADKSDASLMKNLDIRNTFALRELKDAMRHYNAGQAIGAIHALREFDTKSKGIESFQDEYALLRELIYNIFILR